MNPMLERSEVTNVSVYLVLLRSVKSYRSAKSQMGGGGGAGKSAVTTLPGDSMLQSSVKRKDDDNQMTNISAT